MIWTRHTGTSCKPEIHDRVTVKDVLKAAMAILLLLFLLLWTFLVVTFRTKIAHSHHFLIIPLVRLFHPIVALIEGHVSPQQTKLANLHSTISETSNERREEKGGLEPEVPPDSLERKAFMAAYSESFGYPGRDVTPQMWRGRDFPRMKGSVYLDYAGAAIYGEEQLKAAMNNLSSNLYANPHSENESSHRTSDVIEEARIMVLKHCSASPSDYLCVFTGGATSALRLLGECFPWSDESQFFYTRENHNSVLGIREYALEKGATAVSVDIERERNLDETRELLLTEDEREAAMDPSSLFRIRQRATMRRHVAREGGTAGSLTSGKMTVGKTSRCHLFAMPVECNFSGVRWDLGVVPHVKKGQHTGTENSSIDRWFVLLDAAKACGSGPPNLKQYPADFVALSFYKIFGYPTGLGALLIRKDAFPVLQKRYFGGGTVAAVLTDSDYMEHHERPETFLEDGTVSFLGIAALESGFSTIQRLGMKSISRHVGSLTEWTAHQLSILRHGNGRHAVVLYGNHRKGAEYGVTDVTGSSEKRREKMQGPIIAFNLVRADGSWVGFREVEKLASLNKIHLRSGCFCNPGACAKFLGLTENDVKENFEAGHVCGDGKEILNGRPVGAVRISFGHFSTFEDAWEAVKFVEKYFVDLGKKSNGSEFSGNERKEESEFGQTENIQSTPSGQGSIREIEKLEPSLVLEKIIVYPIKSCGGCSVDIWPLGEKGLLYDREFLLVDSSGIGLTQKKLPKLCKIMPRIDLEREVMEVRVENMETMLSIPLNGRPNCRLDGGVRVCGDKTNADVYNAEVQSWFTEAIGVPCSLVRQVSRGRETKRRERKRSDVKTEREWKREREGRRVAIVAERPITEECKREKEEFEKGDRERDKVESGNGGEGGEEGRVGESGERGKRRDRDGDRENRERDCERDIGEGRGGEREGDNWELHGNRVSDRERHKGGGRDKKLDRDQAIEIDAGGERDRGKREWDGEVRRELREADSEGERALGRGGRELSFANEGQFLLVNKSSVEDLAEKMAKRRREARREQGGDRECPGENYFFGSQKGNEILDVMRFRPNFVVSGGEPFEEDTWQAVCINGEVLVALGGCSRCDMVNVDQVTGVRTSSDPLLTLATYRRQKGKILFGLLLTQSTQLGVTSRDDLTESVKFEPGYGKWLRQRYKSVVSVGGSVMPFR